MSRRQKLKKWRVWQKKNPIKWVEDPNSLIRGLIPVPISCVEIDFKDLWKFAESFD